MKKNKILSILITAISILAFCIGACCSLAQLKLGEGWGWSDLLGWDIYANKNMPLAMMFGIVGLIAFLWDMTFGAYMFVDGEYRKIFCRVGKYGYFGGVVVAIANFIFLLTYIFINEWRIAFSGVVFLILLVMLAVLKVLLVLNKNEND